jgi:hypothetical protein
MQRTKLLAGVLCLMFSGMAPLAFGQSTPFSNKTIEAFYNSCYSEALKSILKNTTDSTYAKQFSADYCHCAASKYSKDFKYFTRIILEKGAENIAQDKRMKKLIAACIQDASGVKENEK